MEATLVAKVQVGAVIVETGANRSYTRREYLPSTSCGVKSATSIRSAGKHIHLSLHVGGGEMLAMKTRIIAARVDLAALHGVFPRYATSTVEPRLRRHR